MNQNHILLATNDEYFMPTIVSIHSIIVNNRQMNLVFHILHNGIQEKFINRAKTWIAYQYPSVKLEFCKVAIRGGIILPIKPGDPVTQEAYFRILACDVLPETIDKIVKNYLIYSTIYTKTNSYRCVKIYCRPM